MIGAGLIRLYVGFINVLWRCFGVGSIGVGAVVALDAATSTDGSNGTVGAGVAILLLGVGTLFIGPLKPSHIGKGFAEPDKSTEGQSSDSRTATSPNKSLERTRER